MNAAAKDGLSKYLSDGLHLTADGYRVISMGQFLASLDSSQVTLTYTRYSTFGRGRNFNPVKDTRVILGEYAAGLSSLVGIDS